jgi:hypothetical protein
VGFGPLYAAPAAAAEVFRSMSYDTI